MQNFNQNVLNLAKIQNLNNVQYELNHYSNVLLDDEKKNEMTKMTTKN